MEPSRFEDERVLLLAGLDQHYPNETGSDIPAQWQRFLPYVGNVPGQVGPTTYGVRRNRRHPDIASYMCAVEVSDFSLVPPDLVRLRIPEQRYAVFTHPAHVSSIRDTWHTIFQDWLPKSEYEEIDSPDFERYGEEFDPRRGTGGVEIWVPVKR